MVIWRVGPLSLFRGGRRCSPREVFSEGDGRQMNSRVNRREFLKAGAGLAVGGLTYLACSEETSAPGVPSSPERYDVLLKGGRVYLKGRRSAKTQSMTRTPRSDRSL